MLVCALYILACGLYQQQVAVGRFFSFNWKLKNSNQQINSLLGHYSFHSRCSNNGSCHAPLICCCCRNALKFTHSAVPASKLASTLKRGSHLNNCTNGDSMARLAGWRVCRLPGSWSSSAQLWQEEE